MLYMNHFFPTTLLMWDSTHLLLTPEARYLEYEVCKTEYLGVTEHQEWGGSAIMLIKLI